MLLVVGDEQFGDVQLAGGKEPHLTVCAVVATGTKDVYGSEEAGGEVAAEVIVFLGCFVGQFLHVSAFANALDDGMEVITHGFGASLELVKFGLERGKLAVGVSSDKRDATGGGRENVARR